ncbi:phosphodiesterase [Mycoplasma sp. P36-A1]|uniref:phosphodiesterase n=1 Tax=Mycoplasma sp. P36-A1 TaxID=3252900 RepID=UPI003C2B61F4
MKILIASDIHGSAFYTNKLIQCILKEKPDKIVLLGDLLYHGPRNDLPKEYNPKLVIEQLNKYKDIILAVRGNCDSEVDQMVLEFPMMSDYLELYINNQLYLFTHGHLFEKNILPSFNRGSIVISGHTHISQNKLINGVYYLNPGSISIPKNNTENSYMIINNNILYWKNLDGIIFDELKIM